MPSKPKVRTIKSRADLQGEVWKDILGYEGYYQVSDLGRVYSVPRISQDKDGVRIRRIGGRFLKGLRSREGNFTIKLYRETSHRNVSCAYLVWEAFHSPPPFAMVVDHLDGDRGNCRLGNLFLRDVQRLSASHQKKHGRKPHAPAHPQDT